MSIASTIKAVGKAALLHCFEIEIPISNILVNETKPDFIGDYTIVLFPFVKQAKVAPDALGNRLGAYFLEHHPEVFVSFQTVKGFLNLTLHQNCWFHFLESTTSTNYGFKNYHGSKVMVEYSSPNTNKPLHLGHLRNNFLGWSVAEIFKANGYDVKKTCIVNDRGMHICKSMLAWQQFANGATPLSTGIKGDHLVGDYYVAFENALRNETTPILDAMYEGVLPRQLDNVTQQKAIALLKKVNDITIPAEKQTEIKDELKEIARNGTPLMTAVRSMLQDWEKGDPAILQLWKTMNSWVYAGFDVTYERIGSDFDITYFESDTYLLGKELVDKGLEEGVFFKKEDGSVWIDLTNDGLDEKLVLRKDGTSVYITQDIGLAQRKYDDFPMEQSIYVIGDEQNYHMKVLQLIGKKMKMPFSDGIHHLSYGMVDLPTGRMKSREGTVVDADDLCDEMERVAEAKTKELGKVADFSDEELSKLYHTLGMGALKFYLLRVDPQKRMVFNPEESIDFQGFTGPFVQYSYARIQSVLRKANFNLEPIIALDRTDLLPLEKELVKLLEQFESIIEQACLEMSPALIANYVFQVAKCFNAFYAAHSIAHAETTDKQMLRLRICFICATVLRNGLSLLGIEVPERM